MPSGALSLREASLAERLRTHAANCIPACRKTTKAPRSRWLARQQQTSSVERTLEFQLRSGAALLGWREIRKARPCAAKAPPTILGARPNSAAGANINLRIANNNATLTGCPTECALFVRRPWSYATPSNSEGRRASRRACRCARLPTRRAHRCHRRAEVGANGVRSPNFGSTQ